MRNKSLVLLLKTQTTSFFNHFWVRGRSSVNASLISSLAVPSGRTINGEQEQKWWNVFVRKPPGAGPFVLLIEVILMDFSFFSEGLFLLLHSPWERGENWPCWPVTYDPSSPRTDNNNNMNSNLRKDQMNNHSADSTNLNVLFPFTAFHKIKVSKISIQFHWRLICYYSEFT